MNGQDVLYADEYILGVAGDILGYVPRSACIDTCVANVDIPQK